MSAVTLRTRDYKQLRTRPALLVAIVKPEVQNTESFTAQWKQRRAQCEWWHHYYHCKKTIEPLS